MSAGGPKQVVLCGCRVLIFLFLVLCGTIFSFFDSIRTKYL